MSLSISSLWGYEIILTRPSFSINFTWVEDRVREKHMLDLNRKTSMHVYTCLYFCTSVWCWKKKSKQNEKKTTQLPPSPEKTQKIGKERRPPFFWATTEHSKKHLSSRDCSACQEKWKSQLRTGMLQLIYWLPIVRSEHPHLTETAGGRIPQYQRSQSSICCCSQPLNCLEAKHFWTDTVGSRFFKPTKMMYIFYSFHLI